MAQKVLDETKRVLELIDESEENVSLLQEDLNQKKNLYQEIKDNLKELRDLKNKNIAELEDNQHLKSNIKNCNQHFVDFAQQIYSLGQELYSDLNSHDHELTKNEEMLYKMIESTEKELNKCKVMENTLTTQFESMEQEEKENTKKNELEMKEIRADNEELQAEINILKEKIYSFEAFIQNEVSLSDDEKNCEAVLENLQKRVHMKECELEEFSKSLEEMKQFKEKLESDGGADILQLDHQIENCEMGIKEITSTTMECQQNIDEVSRKIWTLVQNNKSKEETYSNYGTKLKDIEISKKDLEEATYKTITYCEKLILEKGEMQKRQEGIKEQLKSDMCTVEDKIKQQQELLRDITKFLEENKPLDMDLDLELSTKEEHLKELKTTHHKLKEEYVKGSIELETKLKEGQEGIEAGDETNKKLQDDIDSLSSELNEIKNGTELLATKKVEQAKAMEMLDDKIKSLNVELERVHAERLKSKKTNNLNISASQASGNKRRPCHWDSDSSIEEEDRRFSELVKQKMKLNKMPKGSGHK